MTEVIDEINVRRAQRSDLPQLVEIFNHYVANGNVSFGTELHTVESRTPWFESYGQGRYHLLVAEDNRGVLGCAYSSRYRPTPPFDYTVETSIYLHPEKRRNGIGTRLYTELFKILETQPIHLLVAGIAHPNPASIGLHKKFGFEEVGTFKEYARKNNVWISSTWFQKLLAEPGSGASNG
jgi:phosphinothricin acetyltransferase